MLRLTCDGEVIAQSSLRDVERDEKKDAFFTAGKCGLKRFWSGAGAGCDVTERPTRRRKSNMTGKADEANKKPMYEYTGFFVHLLRI